MTVQKTHLLENLGYKNIVHEEVCVSLINFLKLSTEELLTYDVNVI